MSACVTAWLIPQDWDWYNSSLNNLRVHRHRGQFFFRWSIHLNFCKVATVDWWMCFWKALFLRSWQQTWELNDKYSSLHCREVWFKTNMAGLWPYHVLYIFNCVQRAVPYVLVTCRKLSKSVYRLLQLFFFGSSAVAKLQNITKNRSGQDTLPF